MPSRRKRKFLVPMLAIGIGLLFPLVLLEIALRFLPVNEGLRTQSVNAQNPVPRFEPNRTSTFSRNWNFSIVNSVRTNNYGFVNGQDYDPADSRPLIALVGDSYVEAVMVPYTDTAAGRLAASVGDSARVYSFGASGSALSQYLAYAEFVRDTFKPSALVILVIGNDFDESLLKYKDWPGQTLFTEDERGGLVLVRRDYTPSLPRLAAQQSALAMYLITNVGLSSIQHLWQSWRKPAAETWVGNTAASASEARILDSKRAVDAFLEQLPGKAGLPPSRIIIAVEANRQLIYGTITAKEASGSYFEIMRQDLLSKAGSAGYNVVDLHTAFSEHWDKHQQRFEWEDDWHWNGKGHALFADQIEPILLALLPQPNSHPHAADTP